MLNSRVVSLDTIQQHSPPRTFCVARSPSREFPFNNCVAVHPGDFPDELVHILINNSPLTVRHDKDGQIAPGFIGVSLAQRHWIGTAVGAQVTVERFPRTLGRQTPKFARAIEIEVDSIRKANRKEFYAKPMATSFVDDFKGTVVTTGRQIPFLLHGEELIGTIKSVNLAGDSSVSPPSSRNNTGVVFAATNVIISKAPGSAIIIKPGIRPVHTAPVGDGFSQQIYSRTRPPTQQELGRHFSRIGKLTINGGIFVVITTT